MALTTKKFTYDLPDEYLIQTNTLGLTGEWTYEGPDKIYVMIDRKTNKICTVLNWLVYDDTKTREENDEFADMFSGLDFDYALIDANEEPLLLAAVVGGSIGPEESTLPQKTYTLEGETEPFYSRPDPTFPDHTIEVADVEWDPTANAWKKPFPWKKPHITKEQLLSALDNVIRQEKKVDTEGFTSTQKTKWAAYLTALENVPTKFAAYLDTPWMVPFPINPMWSDNWSASKGNAFGLDNKAGEEKVEKPEGPVEYIGEKPYRDGKEIDISTVEPPQTEPLQEETTPEG